MSPQTSLAEVFEHDEDAFPVRIELQDGEPWFVAADVCRVLGIKQATRAVESLDEDERGVTITHTPGGDQRMLIVSESGLYALIFRSRKPVAKKFRKWVTAEVLPAIRRTGRYQAPPPEAPAGLPRDRLEMAEHYLGHQELRVLHAARALAPLYKGAIPIHAVAAHAGLSIEKTTRIGRLLECLGWFMPREPAPVRLPAWLTDMEE